MPIDPLTALFIASSTSIVSIVGTLTVQWIVARFSQHATYAALKAENAVLVKRDTESQSKILELQSYIDKHLTIRAILGAFTVEPSSGDLLRDGIRFCPKCFHDGSVPPKEIQKSFSQGKYWCPVCGKPPGHSAFVGGNI